MNDLQRRDLGPARGVVIGAARTRRIAELVMDAIAAQGFRVAG